MAKLYFTTPGKMKLYLGHKCEVCGQVSLTEKCFVCQAGYIKMRHPFVKKYASNITKEENDIAM